MSMSETEPLDWKRTLGPAGESLGALIGAAAARCDQHAFHKQNFLEGCVSGEELRNKLRCSEH
jgi:hypothetical protein